jgi:tryptophan-rich sensory protein
MSDISRFKQILGLAAWLAVTFLAAAIGGAASIQADSFYAELVQPSWAPSSWVFGPVWSALYVSMGVAAWLVWRVDGFRSTRMALNLFLAQLVFNSLWSWLFFAWHRGALAFADILLLWILIAATIVGFLRVRAAAGWLLVPYLLWVTFATALNYALWKLNPEILG